MREEEEREQAREEKERERAREEEEKEEKGRRGSGRG